MASVSLRHMGSPRPERRDKMAGSVESRSQVRDTTAEALLAAYNTRKLLAVTSRVPKAVAIDELPLARIKRIMKQDSCDPHPRMVSADTIPMMAYCTQLFIGSITSLAWQLSVSPSGRNTLQVKDLKNAVHASKRFDFLIDVLDEFDTQQVAGELQAATSAVADAERCATERSTAMGAEHAAVGQVWPTRDEHGDVHSFAAAFLDEPVDIGQ